MVIWPLLITCLVLPATLPVLTLALDLSGYIGADQLEKLKHRHEHHGHARSRGMSVAEQVRFCPFCGSQRLVRQGRMRCANCGADGIATKVSVQNPEIGAHVRAKRAAQGATRLLGHFKRAHGAVKVSSKQKLKAGATTAASKAPGQRPQLSDAEKDVPYSA